MMKSTKDLEIEQGVSVPTNDALALQSQNSESRDSRERKESESSQSGSNKSKDSHGMGLSVEMAVINGKSLQLDMGNLNNLNNLYVLSPSTSEATPNSPKAMIEDARQKERVSLPSLPHSVTLVESM